MVSTFSPGDPDVVSPVEVSVLLVSLLFHFLTSATLQQLTMYISKMY